MIKWSLVNVLEMRNQSKIANRGVEVRVYDYIISAWLDYTDKAGILEDVLKAGCENYIKEFSYTASAVKFYFDNQLEINEMLGYALKESEVYALHSFFSNKHPWNDDDPLALEAWNQELLAWWAFDQRAYEISQLFKGLADD